MRLWIGIALAAIASGQTPAQLVAQWDGSGNGQLRGVYNFREVSWDVGSVRGDLSDALLLFGTLNFDGQGGYAGTCQALSGSRGAGPCPPFSGTYKVNVGGIARMTSPQGTVLEALVSGGVLFASTTESDYNDLLIAAQAPAEAPTSATLNGRYWVGSFETPASAPTTFRDALFSATFDGAGNVDAGPVTGYIGLNGATAVNQTLSGVRYSFASGTGTLTIGGTLTAQNLLAGTRTFFVSPEGKFFFGGQTNGFDMIVGIRAPAGDVGPEVSSGLYYAAGVDSDQTRLAQNSTQLETYYSSFLSNGSFLSSHERVFTPANQQAYDYTFTAPYTLAADGSYEETKNGYRWVVGDGGDYQLAIGKGPVIGLKIAAKTSFAGPGINPRLILNAASFTPSTNGVSPGELVTISGTNLASTTVVDGNFPTSLGGVLVLVNSRPAPILEVSPTRITAQIPYITDPTATILVISNGQPLPSVMLRNKATSPGVFLINGTYAAALHADYTLVSPQSPAKRGETIQVYATGLGLLDTAIEAGKQSPNDPLARVRVVVSAYVDGKEGRADFVGLAPGLIGLYQINVVIPSDARTGDVAFEIGTLDSFQSSAILPVAQ